ncbi:MAG: c-type cytochrome, partial [Planctomycetaceae bacterium]|nr:c-type cytochrome [Planctomycetaceae bacterium]
MQITCRKCGAGIDLPAETQSGDLIRCNGCGKKIRIRLRPVRRRVSAPETAPVAPAESPRRNWVLRVIGLAILLGAGAAIWRQQPVNLAALKERAAEGLARTGLIDARVGDSAGDEALATQVAALFEARCHRCHGAGGSDEGGFNFVVRLDKLVRDNAYVTAGSPAESYLFTRIAAGEMPPPDAGERFSEEERDLVRRWIEQGAPAIGGDSGEIELITSDDLLRMMRDDLQQLEAATRRETRYFTLTHLSNAGLSEDELETYRLAMAKLLNSLSWEKDLVSPERVGARETLLRINLLDLGWDAAKWDAIVATDPYAVSVETEDGRAVSDQTGTPVPHVRADWFVSRASRAPLYYKLLEIPDTLNELARRSEIGVDIARNIASDRVVRAAFVRSGVSDNNRMFERHKTPFGGFWLSYDFASSIGRQNVLEHPLGPDGDDSFDHDGGEIIFSLPNGLQGYMLVDAVGKRIEKGPLNIVADDKQSDRAVVAGLSCMSCHANGMIRKQDEVRPTILANRNAYPDADQILRQYPEAQILEAALTEDTDRFESSLKALGFDRLTETSEPIYHMARRFDQEVESELAAAEFGLTKDRFIELLNESPAIAKVLGVLKTPNGKVKRQQ